MDEPPDFIKKMLDCLSGGSSPPVRVGYDQPRVHRRLNERIIAAVNKASHDHAAMLVREGIDRPVTREQRKAVADAHRQYASDIERDL